VEVFNSEEREVIHNEFTFNNPYRYIRNEQPRGDHREEQALPVNGFTEQMMDSADETLRNASTKSVILAPFNSSVSDGSRVDLAAEVRELMLRKADVLGFAARCRDQDRQYEINNNCELDNGVYHKFVYSSGDGDNLPISDEDPSRNDTESSH